MNSAGQGPVEPPRSPWHFPDPARVADWADDDLVAIGADLAPGTLLSAYRSGLFPMPLDDEDPMGWFSPQQRGVLPLGGLRVTASLRKSCKHFEIRVDTAFEEVMRACGDPERDGFWITEEFIAAYTALHELGWAHSVEAWRDGQLAGGLYGLAIGGLFAGESMFHRQRDASKVALVGLVDLLTAGGTDPYADQRLLDVQWRTDHLATLGVVEIPRATYLRRLRTALKTPLPAALG
ncbi:leucyl/phenylalanyl-tRNA--protein transferase [Nocardioides jejuensis]|uniref:leucyl/phenylalanyl-tRNA--protein transferase n=1 Tax=Nocardioides jejuensis TaxID=2502782 RepID=UPI001FB2FA05|nr:leucyl/phenylalanyl-tRNA--protein transferase [Nocardioides jejuensis]